MVTHGQWRFTQHAEKRRIEMRLTRNRVVDAIHDAECTWTTTSHGNGATVYAHEEISVVAVADSRDVVTVLPRTVEDYDRAS